MVYYFSCFFSCLDFCFLFIVAEANKISKYSIEHTFIVALIVQLASFALVRDHFKCETIFDFEFISRWTSYNPMHCLLVEYIRIDWLVTTQAKILVITQQIMVDIFFDIKASQRLVQADHFLFVHVTQISFHKLALKASFFFQMLCIFRIRFEVGKCWPILTSRLNCSLWLVFVVNKIDAVYVVGLLAHYNLLGYFFFYLDRNKKFFFKTPIGQAMHQKTVWLSSLISDHIRRVLDSSVESDEGNRMRDLSYKFESCWRSKKLSLKNPSGLYKIV